MASTKFTRTQTAGDRTKFTFSAWVKRGAGAAKGDFEAGNIVASSNGSSKYAYWGFQSDKLRWLDYDGGNSSNIITTRIFRDPNAWYHLILAVDSTIGSGATDQNERVKVYVNGVRETAFDTLSPMGHNAVTPFNDNGLTYIIGVNQDQNGSYFDGSMANIEYVDGLALTPAYFGSTDSNTGIWTAKATSSISDYGTNGFKLKMDTASPGADTSGKGNTFTPAGSPTLLQGSPSNNWATINTLNQIYQGSASNGNTTVTGTTADNYSNSVISSMAFDKGKWYWETKYAVVNSNTNACVGATAIDAPYQYNTNPTATNGGYISPRFDGELIYNSSGTSSYFPAITSAGTIIMQALDMDNKKYWIGINGSWYGTTGNTNGNPATGANPSVTFTEEGFWVPTYRILASKFECNFGEGFFGTTAAGTNADDNGQGLFAYDVPAGYYAMNTKNLEAYG